MGGGRTLKFILKKSTGGMYRFELVGDKGQVIATGSKGYTSESQAKRAITSIKRSAASADVEVVRGRSSR
jgi:uncharacterized protein YegP (UPF0339 family)